MNLAEFWGHNWGNIQKGMGEQVRESVAGSKRLTALAARKAMPREKPCKLAVGGGLYLEVMPTGAKYWRWKYRYGGKEKRIALGVFPQVTLAQAGELRDGVRAKLRAGIDPATQRKLDKLAGHLAAENSFEAIAREWLDTKAGEWVPDHSAKVSAWLEHHGISLDRRQADSGTGSTGSTLHAATLGQTRNT